MRNSAPNMSGRDSRFWRHDTNSPRIDLTRGARRWRNSEIALKVVSHFGDEGMKSACLKAKIPDFTVVSVLFSSASRHIPGDALVRIRA